MNKLNVYCPINGTGYGITSTNISLSLMKKEIDVSIFPIGQGVMLDDPLQREIMLKMLNNSLVYDDKAPCLKIWHQHDLASRIGKGEYYVMPFFEIDKLYEREVHNINKADAIFTPTKWSQKVLESNGVNIPIYLAPLGVDLKIFANSMIKEENDDYIFLHVGKWEKRKSQDFLLEAFENAFTHKDNVKLYLCPYNPFLSDKDVNYWLNLVSQNKLSEKIKIFNRLPTQYDLAKVMNKADCGVFLSRAEGWNNEIPEMMAMNRPIIATDYSAHTEYCNKDNAYLVDVDETEPAEDGKWFHGFGNWAKLNEKQMEQTVEHMRFVYNNRVNTNSAGFETAAKYSWDNTANHIYNVLTERESI
jgi:glycosyltransferase involved in cell wall biosynthesis